MTPGTGAHRDSLGHRIAEARIPFSCLGKPGTVTCDCGAAVTALPDAHLPDPWEPLAEAFRRHRAAAGMSAGNPKLAGTPTDFRFGRDAIPGTRGVARAAG